MNRELTLREKVLLLILIVLVMVLGYFKLLYEPVSDRIARCREDTAQEQLALEQNAVRLAQMEKMEQALADIRAAGGSKAIPALQQQRGAAARAAQPAHGHGGILPRFRRRHDAAGLYRLRPVSMTYRTGTYEQSRAIIDRLSASDNINRISDLSIRRDERSGGQGYQTMLTVTYFEVAP